MSLPNKKLAALGESLDESSGESLGDTLPADLNGPTETFAQEGLSASLQVLPLPAGLFLFAVREATARAPRHGNNLGNNQGNNQGDKLSLPAVHVGVGPGVRAGQVEFMHGSATRSGWLFAAHDLLVARVKSGGATLILSSLRAPGGDVLSIKVERLDARTDAGSSASAEVEAEEGDTGESRPLAVGMAAVAAVAARPSLKLQVAAHIRTRGDMNFADGAWAGRVAEGLWIESFAVRPLERFGEQDIEYKGLTASGFETPWVTDARMCGTKGMSTPLVGFAVRLRPGAEAAAYDCEYSGYFRSGTVVGPLRNGAPCRSTHANDPLEGIQLHIVRRMPAMPARGNVASAGAALIKPFAVPQGGKANAARARGGESKTALRKQVANGRARVKPLRAVRRK